MLDTKTKEDLKTLLDQMGKSFDAAFNIKLDPGLVREIAHKVLSEKIYNEVYERVKDLSIIELSKILLILDEPETPPEIRTDKTIRRPKKKAAEDPSVN